MTERATVQLDLQAADAARKLQAFRRDAAAVRRSFSALPPDVRLAQREMTALAQRHVQIGHLNRRERAALRDHQTYVERHHETVQRQAEHMRAMLRSHPEMARYLALQAGAPGPFQRAVRNDADLAGLHAQMQQLGGLDRQQAAMAQSAALAQQHGVGSGFDLRAAASYYGRRAMFGRGPDGAPNTPGQWAMGGLRRGVQRVRSVARQATGMFALFEGLTLLTRSMNAYEQQAEAVQALGARMGRSFSGVGDELTKLRQHWKYTRQEVMPGLLALARITGNTGRANRGLAFARATGIAPSEVLSTLAEAAPYGWLRMPVVERAINAAGMRDRPEMGLRMVTAAHRSLGAGHYEVPDDLAARYAAFVGQTMGDPFRGPRGVDFIQRLIGGVQHAGDGPGGLTAAVRMNAVRGMGKLDLGGGVIADTRTLRGMRMALESGNPRVLQRLYAEAIRLGGRGELGEELFQGLAGSRLSMVENRRLWNQLGQGARVPSLAEIERFPTFDADRKRVMTDENAGFKVAKLASSMETEVYEPLGEKLLPVAQDFKTAALRLLDGLQKATNAMEALQAVQDAMAALGPDATSPWTKWVARAGAAASSEGLLEAGLKLSVLEGVNSRGWSLDELRAIREGIKNTSFLQSIGADP